MSKKYKPACRSLRPGQLDRMMDKIKDSPVKEKKITEKQRLSDAVDQFAEAMKKRLFTKYNQGWHGWNGEFGIRGDIPDRMLKNASHARETKSPKSLIDTANFAMMIWNERKERQK